MRIFVTGASGWIGSATSAELLKDGHQVLGLARSEESAAKITALGADVHRGSLDDLDSLRSGVAQTDGVVHLGYNHDFSQMGDAAMTDRCAVDAMGAELAGTDRPFVVASGTLGAAPGHVLTENDTADPNVHPRASTAMAVIAMADQGVRSSIVRFAPTVHGPGDHGFIATLVRIAREKGVCAYVDEGENRWPAVHRLDAGKLVSLAVQHAVAGSALHAVAEEGIATRDIAEAIGSGLGVPTVSVPADQTTEHFGWIGMFWTLDARASSDITRKSLNWEPTHQGLLADLKEGSYFEAK